MKRAKSSDKWTNKGSSLSLLLVLLIALMAAWPVVAGPGMVNTRAGGDSPFLLQRVYEMSRALADGQFPVRWMAGGAQGLGYPFYNYYAALPYYIASGLNLLGLGIIGSIQATQILGFVLAAIATYMLVLELGHRQPAALVAAAVYTFAPFHLINVYVRGDSLSEFYAMALFPVILYAALRLLRKPSFWRFAGLAASFAGLMLSHNISAMLFSPLVAMWILVLTFQSPNRWHSLSLGVGALALGAVLSAWFWLPALWEQSLVQLGDQTTGYFDFRGHLTNAFVQKNLIHDYSISANATPFAMGAIEAFLGVVAFAATIRQWVKKRQVDLVAALITMATLGYTWLMTPSSLPVWENVPLLPYTQFPWRLLSIQALGIALLCPTILEFMNNRWQRIASIAIVLSVALCGMAGLKPDYLPINQTDVTPSQLYFYETYSGNTGTTIRHEYLPADFIPRPQASAVSLEETATPLVLEGAINSAELVERDSTSQTWMVESEEKSLIAFHTTFFPGWEAVVDEQPQGIEPLGGLGLCGLRLEPGRHVVTLYLANSRVRSRAEWASAAALVIFIGLLVAAASKNRVIRGRLLVCTGICAGLILWAVISPFEINPRAIAGPRVADFARAPYLHAEPEGLMLGEAVLTGYRYSSDKLLPGDDLTILFEWQTIHEQDYQIEIQLVSATAHLYEPAPVWSTAQADLSERELSLTIPGDIAPGLYVLRLITTSNGVPVTAKTADGVEMSTPVLAPIQITTGGAPENGIPLSGYGPENGPTEISLMNVQTLRPEPSLVSIEMTWRSEHQASLNYMLSVRIKRPDGTTLISRDLPPLLGCYPTSLWHPEDTFVDRVLLPVSSDLVPGTYTVEVVLYDRLTLKGVGSMVQEVEL